MKHCDKSILWLSLPLPLSLAPYSSACWLVVLRILSLPLVVPIATFHLAVKSSMEYKVFVINFVKNSMEGMIEERCSLMLTPWPRVRMFSVNLFLCPLSQKLLRRLWISHILVWSKRSLTKEEAEIYETRRQ